MLKRLSDERGDAFIAVILMLVVWIGVTVGLALAEADRTPALVRVDGKRQVQVDVDARREPAYVTKGDAHYACRIFRLGKPVTIEVGPLSNQALVTCRA